MNSNESVHLSRKNDHWYQSGCLCAIAATLIVVTASPAYAAKVPVLNRLQKLAQELPSHFDIATVGLLAAKELHPDLDVKRHLAQLASLADQLRPQLATQSSTEAKLRTMARLIYGEWGFAEQRVLPATVFVGFDDVLNRKHWNCFGMTLLYLALGDRVGLPLKMVAGHGHVFIQCAGAPPCYVETTQQGRIYPDKKYLKSYLPFPCVDPNAYVALDKRQTAAVVISQTALALQNRRQPTRAQAFYQCALRFSPGYAEAQAGVGFALLAQGQVDKAITAFREVITGHPDFRAAYGGLGDALHAKGNSAGAVQAYRKLVALCPQEPKAQFNLGQLLYASKDLDGAIAAFRAYIKLAPNDPDGYARLAFPLEDSGDLDGALAAYRKAVALNPRYTDAYINMGDILIERGDATAAKQAFQSALALQPKHPLALDGMGRSLARLNQTKQALEYLRKATTQAPANATLWLDYGNALRLAGDIPRAVEACQRATECDSTAPDAYLALAEAQRAAGHIDKAKAAAEKALTLGSKLSPSLKALVTVSSPGR